jgi:hypothetical protein
MFTQDRYCRSGGRSEVKSVGSTAVFEEPTCLSTIPNRWQQTDSLKIRVPWEREVRKLEFSEQGNNLSYSDQLKHNKYKRSAACDDVQEVTVTAVQLC